MTTAGFLLVVGIVPKRVQRLPYQCVRVEHEGGPFDRVTGSNPFRPDREFDCVLPACQQGGDNLGDIASCDTANGTAQQVRIPVIGCYTLSPASVSSA